MRISILAFLLIFLILNLILIYFPVGNLIVLVKQIELSNILVTHYIAIASAFIIISIMAIVCCLPLSGILRVLSGYLFGSLGFAYSLLAASISAYLMFLFGNKIEYKNTSGNKNIERKIKKRPYLYLFILRVVPIFPGWLVNFTCGALRLRVSKFLVISIFGFIPNIAILTYVGAHITNYVTTPTNFITSPWINMILLILLLISSATHRTK